MFGKKEFLTPLPECNYQSRNRQIPLCLRTNSDLPVCRWWRRPHISRHQVGDGAATQRWPYAHWQSWRLTTWTLQRLEDSGKIANRFTGWDHGCCYSCPSLRCPAVHWWTLATTDVSVSQKTVGKSKGWCHSERKMLKTCKDLLLSYLRLKSRLLIGWKEV